MYHTEFQKPLGIHVILEGLSTLLLKVASFKGSPFGIQNQRSRGWAMLHQQGETTYGSVPLIAVFCELFMSWCDVSSFLYLWESVKTQRYLSYNAGSYFQFLSLVGSFVGGSKKQTIASEYTGQQNQTVNLYGETRLGETITNSSQERKWTAQTKRGWN